MAVPPRRTPTASAGWQSPPPHLNRVGSVPSRTSTANSGWQCPPPVFPPDLNDVRVAAFPAQPRASAGSVQFPAGPQLRGDMLIVPEERNGAVFQVAFRAGRVVFRTDGGDYLK